MNFLKSLFLVIVGISITAAPNAFARYSGNGNKELPVLSVAQKEEIKSIVAESSILQGKIVKFTEEQRKNPQVGPLRINDINRLVTLMEQYLELRDRFSREVVMIGFFTERTVQFNLSKKRASSLNEYLNNSEGSSSSFESNWKYNVQVNPKDAFGKQIITTIEVALAGSLALFQNFNDLFQPVMENPRWRRLVSIDYPEIVGKMNSYRDGFVDHISRDRLMNLVKFYSDYLELIYREGYSISKNEFSEMVADGDIFQAVNKNGFPAFTHSVKYFGRSILDGLTSLVSNAGFYGSALFGNFAGIFQFRSGMLKNLDQSEKENINSNLKPLDILLEKTPFRLTDSFIPGYYGHVAIYLGTEEQLKEMGLWNHPLIQKYADQILQGKTIAEAVRIPGVRLTSFERFLDIDDLLILRRNTNDTINAASQIIIAFEQLGKKYDFNFDVETQNKIVCSELVYEVFQDMVWPTHKTMGRYTISPDNVAIKAIGEDSEFNIINLYQNGKNLEESKRAYYLENLLKFGALERESIPVTQNQQE